MALVAIGRRAPPVWSPEVQSDPPQAPIAFGPVAGVPLWTDHASLPTVCGRVRARYPGNPL